MKKIAVSIRKSLAVRLGRSLFVIVLGGFCISQAAAQCGEWDLTAPLTIDQSDGYRVAMTLKQDGTELSGSAEYARRAGRSVPGKVRGSISGDDFEVEVTWDKGGIGLYQGKLIQAPGSTRSPTRVMDGTVVNKVHPGPPVKWSLRQKIGCKGNSGAGPTGTPPAIETASPNGSCPRWDVSGMWSLTQEDGLTVFVSLRQSGTKLIGSADHTIEGRGFKEVVVAGVAKGEIRDDTLALSISWSSPEKQQVADYLGKIDQTGKISGTVSFTVRRGFGWSSVNRMKCFSGDAGVILR